MANHWYRFYREVLDDPKVQTLPPDLFKFWVNLLCLGCKYDGTLPPLECIAFALRTSLDETKKAFHILLKANLIDERKTQHGQTFTPHNWAKRQFKSDSSTERVKRFRAVTRNKAVTPSESDTESDTDTEQKNTKKNFSLNGFHDSFAQFWQSYPKKVGKGAAEKTWAKIKPNAELVAAMIENVRIQKQSPKWTENGGEFIPYPSKWLNEKRWLDEPVVVEKKKIPMKDWI